MDRKSNSRRQIYQMVKDGQTQKAAGVLAELLSSGEGEPYDFVYLGDLLLQLDRVTEAVERYEGAISAYARLGFNRNAIALCRKILRLDGGRGDILRRLGDFHVAEESVGDALHAYHAYLEKTNEEERDTAEFRETLQRMEELAPQRADFAIRMSEFCRKIDRPDTALAVLAKAVRQAEEAGRDEAAAELRERLAALGPGMLGRPDEAPPAREAWGDRHPRVAQDAWDENWQDQRTGEAHPDPRWPAGQDIAAAAEEQAIAAQEPAVDREDFRTHYRRATVFMEQGRLDEALAEFDAAARDFDLTAEEAARLQETRGRCLSALGRHREAMREFVLLLQSPTRSDEEQAGRLTLLARECQAVGDLDEARRRLREALAARPEFPEASGLLAEIDERAA
ncbi:MAG: tetratricopeptide repeat protein [Candidatus Eisenbacteria bacterium]|nr:tetratricopeptide repeat protein [Candidatus Eisenbacteria bacterium]